MGASQPSTTTQINKVELPKWVDDASQANYALATEIGSKPLQQFQGPTVANLGQGTTDAWNNFYSSMGTGQDQAAQAAGIFSGVAGGATPQVTAAQFAGTDLAPYMNPFVDNVVNTSMANLERSRQQSTMGNADAATAAKAFGGSRHGVVDAVTNAETALKAGQLSSSLYSDAYNNATGLAVGDINRRQSADVANQGAALQKAGIDLNAGQGLLSAGTTANQLRMQDIAGLSSIGQQQQTQDQSLINAQIKKFEEARGHDTEMLNLRLSALGMSPYGKTETGTKTTSSPGTDPVMAGLGGLSMLAGLFGFSDRDAKTDIEKVGKDSESGLNIYAYRYKGDPKTYPKVVGPMAQEVEKKYPDAVRKIGGKRIVDMKHLVGSFA